MMCVHPLASAAPGLRRCVWGQVSVIAKTYTEEIQDANAKAADLRRPNDYEMDGEISLVAVGADVLFVYWGSFASRQGWRVRLDDRERIKYNVPLRSTREEFHGPILILSINMPMLKVKGSYRLPMPSFALVLRRWHQSQCYNGPLAEHFCVLCSVCVDNELDSTDFVKRSGHDGADVFACMHSAVAPLLPPVGSRFLAIAFRPSGIFCAQRLRCSLNFARLRWGFWRAAVALQLNCARLRWDMWRAAVALQLNCARLRWDILCAAAVALQLNCTRLRWDILCAAVALSRCSLNFARLG